MNMANRLDLAMREADQCRQGDTGRSVGEQRVGGWTHTHTEGERQRDGGGGERTQEDGDRGEHTEYDKENERSHSISRNSRVIRKASNLQGGKLLGWKEFRVGKGVGRARMLAGTLKCVPGPGDTQGAWRPTGAVVC